CSEETQIVRSYRTTQASRPRIARSRETLTPHCRRERSYSMTRRDDGSGAAERPPILISRRQLIHRTVGLGLALTASAPFLERIEAAAAASEVETSSTTLNILTWETYDNQPWLDQFKKKTGITVHATNVGSPAEMFAK